MRLEPCLRPRDVSLARAVARVGLGINIGGHGGVRLPHLSTFVAETVKSFAPTFLQSWSVALTSFLIPPAELAIGMFLVLGLFQRPVLVLGSLLMMELTFGTVLLQEWQIAGIQLFYIAFYAILISTLGFDSYSIDGWRRNEETKDQCGGSRSINSRRFSVDVRPEERNWGHNRLLIWHDHKSRRVVL